MASQVRATSAKGVRGIDVVFGGWQLPFVIINKPAGLPCQLAGDKKDDAVEARIYDAFGGRVKPFFPHRLDKDTQGLLAIALNSQVAGFLSSLHHDKTAWLKQYRVLTDTPPGLCNQGDGPKRLGGAVVPRLPRASPFVHGNILCGASPLDSPCTHHSLLRHGYLRSFLARVPYQFRPPGTPLPPYVQDNPQSRQMWEDLCRESAEQNEGRLDPHVLCSPHILKASRFEVPPLEFQQVLHKSILHESVGRGDPRKGKLAVTEFDLVGVNAESRCAFFVVTLHTGRTHQIRVHFSESGFPITNDVHYNPGAAHTHPDTGERRTMGLQAFRMRLPNPMRRWDTVEVCLPIPSDWHGLLPAHCALHHAHGRPFVACGPTTA